MVGLPAYLSSQVLVRLVILEGRGRRLNETATVQLAINLLADIWFGALWGIVGIAIATSLVTWVGLLLIWWVSRPVGRDLPTRVEVDSHV
jgi:Na+-driven multidrug efflux pump